VIEEVFIRTIPEESLPKMKLEEIRKRLAEMKKGDYATLEEIKSA